MSSCLYCGMELPDASFFCAYCGHEQSSTTMNPTRISSSLATMLLPSDAPMLLRDTAPRLPRRKEEDNEQHCPMAPPMLLFDGQTSSGSVPMTTGFPFSGDLPRIPNLLSRVALSCATAAKLVLAPWIIITLTGIAIFVGAGMTFPHLLQPIGPTQVSNSGKSHQQVIPMPRQSGQTNCLVGGNVHIHDVQINFCTSQPGKAAGNSSSPQQQGTILSSSFSSLTSTALLQQVTNGKLLTTASTTVQKLLNLNNAVLGGTINKTQIGSVLNKSVSTVQQVVRSVVNTPTHLPQVGNTLSKSVSTVHQVVQSTVTTATQQTQGVQNATSTATIQQQLNTVQSAVSDTPTTLQQPRVVQNAVSTLTTQQQTQGVQNTVSTATTQQQPKPVQSTISTTTTNQQSNIGNALSQSTSIVHP